VLCRADLTLESARYPRGPHTVISDVTHVYRDWSAIWDEVEGNESYYIIGSRSGYIIYRSSVHHLRRMTCSWNSLTRFINYVDVERSFGTPLIDAFRGYITTNSLFYDVHSRSLEFPGIGNLDKNRMLQCPSIPDIQQTSQHASATDVRETIKRPQQCHSDAIVLLMWGLMGAKRK